MSIMQCNTCIIDKNDEEQNKNYSELKKIISILNSKIRPAVARDGDIKFKIQGWKVKFCWKVVVQAVHLQLFKKRLENLLCHSFRGQKVLAV